MPGCGRPVLRPSSTVCIPTSRDAGFTPTELAGRRTRFDAQQEPTMRSIRSRCARWPASCSTCRRRLRPATPAAASTSTGEIRPILSESCYQCHGPDRQQAQGRPAARSARRIVPVGRRHDGRRPGQARRERAAGPDHRRRLPSSGCRRRRADKPLDARPGRADQALDRAGGRSGRGTGPIFPRRGRRFPHGPARPPRRRSTGSSAPG